MVISRLSWTYALSFLISFSIILSTAPSSSVQAWGTDGHRIICNIAQQLLNPIALSAVEEMLPDTEDGHLAHLCSWADHIRHTKGYEWSVPLHYIDTPNNRCTYSPMRDCMDAAGTPNACASGAITNYTEQMRTRIDQYNMTEALLFLSNIVGDIHQPLNVGFEGDRGGKSIELHWYNTHTNLHHVWEIGILLRDVNQFFAGNVAALTKSIYENITTVWSQEASHWSKCAGGEIACPDLYATESMTAACVFAYHGASNGTTLSDYYFLSRLEVIHRRLAQAGVRLAGILNQLFPDEGS
ncbi:unnamed protein product [Calypogeia fissa]